MGCDIHPILERKWIDPETGDFKGWVGQHTYPLVRLTKGYHFFRAHQRNYELFAKLAGVRGDGPEPRGMPADASDLAFMHLGNGEQDLGLHSHSWATAREWVAACMSIEPDPEKLFLAPDNDDPRVRNPYAHYLDIDINDWLTDNGQPVDSPDNYRIVFAFDN